MRPDPRSLDSLSVGNWSDEDDKVLVVGSEELMSWSALIVKNGCAEIGRVYLGSLKRPWLWFG